MIDDDNFLVKIEIIIKSNFPFFQICIVDPSVGDGTFKGLDHPQLVGQRCRHDPILPHRILDVGLGMTMMFMMTMMMMMMMLKMMMMMIIMILTICWSILRLKALIN